MGLAHGDQSGDDPGVMDALQNSHSLANYGGDLDLSNSDEILALLQPAWTKASDNPAGQNASQQLLANIVPPDLEQLQTPEQPSQACSLATQWSELQDWLEYNWDDWPDAEHPVAEFCTPASSASSSALWEELPFHLDFTSDSPTSHGFSYLTPPEVTTAEHAASDPPGGNAYIGGWHGIKQPVFSLLSSDLYSIEEGAVASQPAVARSVDVKASYTAAEADARKNITKKRPSAAIQHDEFDPSLEPTQAPRRRRLDHSKVEERYRNKLNDKIRELGDCIPILREDVGNETSNNGAKGKEKSRNRSKGIVLTEAKAYIRELEEKVRRLDEESAFMRRQVQCLGRAATADLSQSAGQGAARSSNLSRLILACLMGIMTTEAVYTTEQDNGGSARGLFAMPTVLLQASARGLYRLHLISHASTVEVLLLLVKIGLLLSIVVLFLWPQIFAGDDKERKGSSQVTRHDSPVAGPQAIRRLGFQTSTQTLCMHTGVVGELAAITRGLIRLGLQLFDLGQKHVSTPDGTHTSPDAELVRVKAWDVLLEAQLAGGDVQISYHRLLMTLVAATSLPETPYRLMMMALHIHLLTWGLRDVPLFSRKCIRYLTALIAHRLWDRARHLQRQSRDEGLQRHLRNLLSLDQDEVFLDGVMQSLHDIVWNAPQSRPFPGISHTISGDPSVHCPLDAVAALWAYDSMQEELTNFLEIGSEGGSTQPHNRKRVQFIIDTAPPDSAALAYVLIARAVLPDESQPKHIGAALRATEQIPANLGFRELLKEGAAVAIGVCPDARLVFQVEFILPLRFAIAAAFPIRAEPAETLRGLRGYMDTSLAMVELPLLALVSLYRFLGKDFENGNIPVRNKELLEEVATLLRRVMSGDKASELGLSLAAQQATANRCLRVFEWIASSD